MMSLEISLRWEASLWEAATDDNMAQDSPIHGMMVSGLSEGYFRPTKSLLLENNTRVLRGLG